MSYLFFLSYARRDAKGTDKLKYFYERLALEVARAAAVPSDVDENEVGFFDGETLEPGDDWPQVLAGALQSCKVLVCLYSKSYFKSRYCGQEFEIFRSRVANYVPSPDQTEPPRLIIPVLWDPPSRLPPLPDAVSNLNYTHAAFGEEYAERGLYNLLKLNKMPEFENCVTELANRIVDEAARHELPQLAKLRTLRNVPSAFHEFLPNTPDAGLDDLTEGDVPPTATLPPISGPDAMWYVYFAGRGKDYRGKRRDISCYGDRGGYQWKPLLPPKEATIGAITPQVAGEQNLTSSVLPISSELVQHLRKAEEDNTIAILVVDPWSVKVQSYNRLMRDYDQYRLDNCAVVVVWNADDPETIEQRDALRADLRDAFERNLRVKDEVFRDSVENESQLLTDLGEVIVKVRDRLRDKSKPARPVPRNGGESFPNINGASGA